VSRKRDAQGERQLGAHARGARTPHALGSHRPTRRAREPTISTCLSFICAPVVVLLAKSCSGVLSSRILLPRLMRRWWFIAALTLPMMTRRALWMAERTVLLKIVNQPLVGLSAPSY
jgi:hypothetical protein